MNRKIVFMHVPRVAGRSIIKSLEQNLNVCHYKHNDYKVDCFVDCMILGHYPVSHVLQHQEGLQKESLQNWYNSCFKFAFVRNTWERLVSVYEYYYSFRRKRNASASTNIYLGSFDLFLETIVSGKCLGRFGTASMTRPFFGHAHSQMKWLQFGVDFIGRYETLESDWFQLCDIVGMPQMRLDVIGAMHRKKDYRSYYTSRMAVKVAERYSEEIKQFRFTFDGGVVK